MQRIFDFTANTYVFVEAPDREPTTPGGKRIPCRVCEQYAPADDARPLLCADCAADLHQCRTRIVAVLEAAQRATEDAWQALEDAVEGADEVTLARWRAFQDAQGTEPARRAEAAVRDGMIGPLAELIRLWLAFGAASRYYGDRQRWAQRADLALVLSEEPAVGGEDLPL